MDWHHRPLSQLLAPLDPAFFLNRVWGRQPWQIVAAEPGKFTSLFDWAALNRLLDGGERLQLVNGPFNASFAPRPEQLAGVGRQLRKGATLVLEAVDRRDAQLAGFLDALSAELGIDSFLNLYLSAPEHPGFALHYDTHDFLILQIYGYKDWEIFAPTVRDPLPHQPASGQTPPAGACLQRLSLAPGDVLYLPKGYWHQALARQEHSLHLTLGFNAPTGIDLLRWLLSACREHPLFRQNLPLLTPTDGQTAPPWQERFEALTAEVNSLLENPQLLPRLEQTHFTELTRRQNFALPHQTIAEAAELEGVARFRVLPVPHGLQLREDGLLELSFPASRLQFEALAGDLLRDLLSRPSFTPADVQSAYPQFPWPAVLEVLLPLVQHGLIVPVNR
ncbi:MAG: cupin domain-containing protein [Candidatus Sericytochromatia bacterium]